MIRGALAALVLASTLSAQPPGEVTAARAEPRGHAHNDYEAAEPLHAALAAGMASIEADVFLEKGKLLVAHTRLQLDPSKTLEGLYLAPLERLRKEGRLARFAGRPLILLIDLKSEALVTWKAVEQRLRRYPDLVQHVVKGQLHRRPVQAVISGNRPVHAIAGATTRHSAIDGRLGDLESTAPLHLMPLISASWRSTFTWRGRGSFPESERRRLEALAREAARQGRLLRFWGAPDHPTAWTHLRAAGVTLLNTDHPARLQRFLKKASR